MPLDNVVNIRSAGTALLAGPGRSDDYTNNPSHGGGGGGGDNTEMLKRISDLEDLTKKSAERLVNIERDLAVIRSEQKHFATRTDIVETKTEIQSVRTAVSESKASTIQWIVGTIIFALVLPQLPAIVRGILATLPSSP